MKKTCFVFIICLLSNVCCVGQHNKIDSLLILLKTDKVDTNKLFHLNKLSREYDNIGSYDSALFFANSALQLSNIVIKTTSSSQIKHAVQKEMGASFNNIGIVCDDQGNYPDAFRNYFASLKIRETINDKSGEAGSYNNIGMVYEHQGNYSEAVKII